jgi:hypothetical protein
MTTDGDVKIIVTAVTSGTRQIGNFNQRKQNGFNIIPRVCIARKFEYRYTFTAKKDVVLGFGKLLASSERRAFFVAKSKQRPLSNKFY